MGTLYSSLTCASELSTSTRLFSAQVGKEKRKQVAGPTAMNELRQ